MYNSLTTQVRPIYLPMFDTLGCDIATGLLHRLPSLIAKENNDEIVPVTEPIPIEVDQFGTIAFDTNVAVKDTEQIISIPFVIYPTHR